MASIRDQPGHSPLDKCVPQGIDRVHIREFKLAARAIERVEIEEDAAQRQKRADKMRQQMPSGTVDA